MALQGRREVHVREDETMETTGNRKRRTAVCIAAALALAVACMALVNCSAESGLQDNESQMSDNSAETRSSRSAEASSAVPSVEDTSEESPAEGSGQQSGSIAGSSGETTSQNVASGVYGGAAQSGSSSGQTPPTAAPVASGGELQKQPVWVVDYEEVWVEDAPGWDESVPIYGYTEVSICNICGADITGNTAAHGKQHMLAGEGSGHHSEVREVITGYETVHHEATGHWERVESGGHWG